MQNKFPPGKKFNQGKLAEELGVSRTPVIKALHKLESEGLIDNIPQKGFYVHQLSIKEMLEIFALREALEAIVMNNLVETITTEQVEQLDKLFVPFDEKWTKDKLEKYKLADQQFHDLQFEWCDNNLAKKVNETFQVLNRTYLGGLIRDAKETLKEHRAIINALKNKDKEKAKVLAVKHISITKDMLQDTVDKLYKIGMEPGDTPVSIVNKKAL